MDGRILWCTHFLCNSVPLHATRESWSVSHHEGYLYISHDRHIEEDIYHIEIIWYISNAPLTSETTTVNLRVKFRLTNEHVIMLNLLTLQSKRKDWRYQRRNQKPYVGQTIQWPREKGEIRSRKSDRQYNCQEKKDMGKQLYKTLHRKLKME